MYLINKEARAEVGTLHKHIGTYTDTNNKFDSGLKSTLVISNESHSVQISLYITY